MAVLPVIRISLAPPRKHPPVIAIGQGVEVCMVGDLIRVDITSDDGRERCTRFLSVLEARQLSTRLAQL
jgi:hypothetical protein